MTRTPSTTEIHIRHAHTVVGCPEVVFLLAAFLIRSNSLHRKLGFLAMNVHPVATGNHWSPLVNLFFFLLDLLSNHREPGHQD